MKISDDLKVKYFDIIYEFGLLTNTGHSPSESAEMSLRIPLEIRDPKDGIRYCCTAYGANLEEVCQRAIEFLNEHGWIGHTEKLRKGLINFAHAVTNTIADSMRIGKVEIVHSKSI